MERFSILGEGTSDGVKRRAKGHEFKVKESGCGNGVKTFNFLYKTSYLKRTR